MPSKSELIDAAQRPAPDDIWPRNDPASTFVSLSIVWLIVIAFGMLIRLGRVPAQYITVIAGIGLVCITAWGVRALILRVRRNRRRRRQGGSDRQSNSAVRLRLVGPADAATAVLQQVRDLSFEPVILRSFHAVQFPVMKDGRVKTVPGRHRRRRLVTRPHRDFWSYGSIAISVIAAAASVLGLQYVAFNSLFPLTVFHVFAFLAFSVLFDALICPAYIRLAPGVMDVMRFGLIGLSTVRCDRYDLRSSRVVVDLDERGIRIDDPSRTVRPVVYLNTSALMGGRRTTPRDVLRAAISTHAAPPLPQDELLG